MGSSNFTSQVFCRTYKYIPGTWYIYMYALLVVCVLHGRVQLVNCYLNMQGITWLKQKEAARNLQMVRLGQKDLLRRLQEALERGYSVIVENMGETIDPIILPVVARAFIRRGNRNVIVLGDDEVEQHVDFRLFLHTKLSNPHFPPEVQAETTMVNFMVTPTGLEDQLLSVVIKTERPDLAAHKVALLQQQNQFRVSF